MNKDILKIFIGFLLCFLMFTPLGLFSDTIDPFEHSSLVSLTMIDAGDDQGYYSYLRSLLADGDIDFFNESNYAYNLYLTKTGYTLNLWPVGPAILWTPFFLAAGCVEWVLRMLGAAGDSKGYGWTYLIATGLGSCFYVFCGLLLLYRTLTLWFSRTASMLAVWTIYLSSPLVYFTFVRNRMGHFAEFFSICLFLFLWFHRPLRERASQWGFSLGCSLALVVMSRYTNAVVALLPAAIYLRTAWKQRGDRNGMRPLNIAVVSALVAFFTVISVQAATSFILYGKIYPDDPHLDKFKSIIVPESLTFFRERLASVLAGPYFGLAYCFQPWLAGFAGLFLLRPDKIKLPPFPGQATETAGEFYGFKWGTVLLSLIPFYLTLNWTLAENSVYGRRLLTASMPFVAVGFAALYDWLRKPPWHHALAGAAALAVFLNLAQTAQFQWMVDYFDPEYSWKAIKNIPKLFTEPQGVLSTSFVKLLLTGGFSLTSAKDWFFIFGIPLLMIVLMVVGCAIAGRKNDATSSRMACWVNNAVPLALAGVALLAGSYLLASHKTFAPEELAKRARFAEILGKYPEFIFNNTMPGNAAELLEAVQLNPQSSSAFVQMGYYYFRTGNHEKAAWHYKQAINLDETNHNAWWAAGMLLKQQEKPEYMDFYFRAMQLQPHKRYRIEYLLEQAAAFFSNNQHQKSIEILTKTTRLAPDWATPYKNIAVVHLRSGNFEQARQFAMRAKALGADVEDILKAVEDN